MQNGIDFQTEPGRYRHWKIVLDGRVAELVMDVDPAGGLFEGYELKLNSYDLGVDIELHDAVQRLRFEHPEVGCGRASAPARRACSAPGRTSACSAAATHAHKVNFCKFTNETRLSIEDACRALRTSITYRRRGRHRGGRRLRAGAGRRPHHADRRPPLHRVAAGDAAAGRAARHRRAHPRHRQATRAGATSPTCSARSRRGSAAPSAVEWRLVDEVVRALEMGEAAVRASAPARWRRRSDRPSRARPAWRSTPLAAQVFTDDRRGATTHVSVRDRPARTHRPQLTVLRAATRRLPADLAGIHAAGRVVLAARDGARAGRRHPAPARQRGRASA